MERHLQNYLAHSALPHPDQEQFLIGVGKLRNHLLKMQNGSAKTAKALSLVGKSGNGKTELITGLPALIPELLPTSDRERPFVYLGLVGPDTPRNLAVNIAEALGLSVGPRETEASITAKIRRRLKALGTLVIALDEAHHSIRGEYGDNGEDYILDRLKTMYIDYQANPIIIVLAGLNELQDTIEQGTQYKRRNIRTAIRALTHAEAAQVCGNLIEKGCERAELKLCETIKREQIALKLPTVADNAFGIMIELVDAALCHALERQSDVLEASDVIAVARIHSGSHGHDVFDGNCCKPTEGLE